MLRINHLSSDYVSRVFLHSGIRCMDAFCRCSMVVLVIEWAYGNITLIVSLLRDSPKNDPRATAWAAAWCKWTYLACTRDTPLLTVERKVIPKYGDKLVCNMCVCSRWQRKCVFVNVDFTAMFPGNVGSVLYRRGRWRHLQWNSHQQSPSKIICGWGPDRGGGGGRRAEMPYGGEISYKGEMSTKRNVL